MKNLKLTGKEINIYNKLGTETIKKIENLFQEKLNISFIDMVNETKVMEMDFNTKMNLFYNGICGAHFEDKKEIWLSDLDNVETLVHEFTHMAQCRRTGIKHYVMRLLTKFSNKMVMKCPIFYKLDLYEKEARYIASQIN